MTDLVAPFKQSHQGKKPWIKPRALRALRRKRNAWNKYRRFGSQENWRRYKHSREVAARTLKSCREQYEERLAARAKLNPKAYFKCVQHKKALRRNIPVLKTGDVTVVDSEGKADLLMKHFQSVYREDSEVPFPPLDIGALAVADMQQVNIVERDVSKSLSYLSFDKAAGPDGVHPR